jgi:hypothetical protein
MRRCPVPASGAYALNCVSRRRSPPWRPSDIRCHRRVRLPRRKPRHARTSRPRPSFRRRPAKSAAIRKTGMPFSVTTREAEGMNPPSPRRLSRSRRPHFVPKLGRVFCLGLASVTVRSPAIRDGSTRRWFGSTDTFWTHRVTPGTDDPSAPASSTDSTVDGS